MPKVGNTVFPYSKEGIAAARSESRKTKQPIKGGRTYDEQAHISAANAKKGKAANATLAGDAETLAEQGGEQMAQPPGRGLVTASSQAAVNRPGPPPALKKRLAPGANTERPSLKRTP